MGNETTWENIDRLYLLCQPIMQVESLSQQELNGYEVLLRSEKNNRFPQQEFSTMIQTESGNQQLMEWYAKELRRLCQKKPETRFSVNIHPQQLLWQSTWSFFETMAVHKEQLQIELTEHPVRIQQESFDLSVAIAKIKAYGYVIAVDDIGCGQNTLSLVFANLASVDCLKFSLLPFIQLDEEIGFSFLACWLKVAQKYQLELIVEGIENREKMVQLLEMGVHLRQGYLWSKGERL